MSFFFWAHKIGTVTIIKCCSPENYWFTAFDAYFMILPVDLWSDCVSLQKKSKQNVDPNLEMFGTLLSVGSAALRFDSN